MKNEYKRFLVFLISGIIFIDFIYGISEKEIKSAIYNYPGTNYYGTETIIFWSENGKSISCESKVFFKSPNKMRIEYKGSKNLSKYIVIDDGEYEYLYNTAKNIVTTSISFYKTDNIDKNFDLLKKNYDLISLGSENIAGRATDIVAIKPKNPENPFLRKIWIDKKYHIILQDKIFQNEELLHLSHFTTIDFPKDLPDKLFVLPQNIKNVLKTDKETSFLDIESAKKKINFKLLVPKFIPEEYVFDKVDLVKKKNYEFVRIQYTDGLNVLSLFETPINIDFRDFQEPEIMNYKILYRKYKGINLTVIGILSKETLRKVINSVR